MKVAILSDIYIYPVKSLSGISVSKWPVCEKGLLLDRKWMLIDSNNQFMSQRQTPKMVLIKTSLSHNELILSTETSGQVSLPLYPDKGNSCHITLWGNHCLAKTTTKEADQWLSDFLETPCRLIYQPDEVTLPVDPDYALSTDKVYFSDGFPFLITSTASLASLNQSMGKVIPMQRFRPNLVISNCESYAEDYWREICINNIGFRLPKPCARCPIPSIDTETAKRNKEPLSTLNRLRKWNKNVYFGQNALHNNTGELSIGDAVTINQTGSQQPPL